MKRAPFRKFGSLVLSAVLFAVVPAQANAQTLEGTYRGHECVVAVNEESDGVTYSMDFRGSRIAGIFEMKLSSQTMESLRSLEEGQVLSLRNELTSIFRIDQQAQKTPAGTLLITLNYVSRPATDLCETPETCRPEAAARSSARYVLTSSGIPLLAQSESYGVDRHGRPLSEPTERFDCSGLIREPLRSSSKRK